MSVPSRTLYHTLEVANGDIWFLDRKRLGVIYFPFVMHICSAKFQEHCVNISRDIVYSVFYHFSVANTMTSSLEYTLL